METAWIIAFSAAISVVFTQGSIFEPLRKHGPKLWRELASCALCSGVWIGSAMFVLLSDFLVLSEFPHAAYKLWIAREIVAMLGAGSLSGCVAVIFVALWDWLNENRPEKEEEKP